MSDFGGSVTVLRSGGKDRFGNILPEATYTVADCAVVPRTSSEPLDRSDTVVSGASLYGTDPAPILSPVPATGSPTLTSVDRVRVTGMGALDGTWSVEGDVGSYQSPFTGWTPGWMAALKRGA